MTLTEQFHIFETLTPEEFIRFCVTYSETNDKTLLVCMYVRIRTKEELEYGLLEIEKNFKPLLRELFSSLDLRKYKRFWIQRCPFTLAGMTSNLKTLFSNIREQAMCAHVPHTERDRSAFMELIKAILENIDFSKNERLTHGLKYNSRRQEELFEAIDYFKGKHTNLLKLYKSA